MLGSLGISELVLIAIASIPSFVLIGSIVWGAVSILKMKREITGLQSRLERLEKSAS